MLHLVRAMGLAILAAAALTACVKAPDYPYGVVMPDAMDGPPPPLGTVTLTGEDGAKQVLTTFDFSVGALDASAWFGGYDQKYSLHLRAFPNANPDVTEGIFSLEAALPAPPVAGMVSDSGKVEILKSGQKSSVMQWSSLRHKTHVEITEVKRDAPDSPFGSAKGSFTTRLCDMTAPEKNDCHDVSGVFDTQVQFDNM